MWKRNLLKKFVIYHYCNNKRIESFNVSKRIFWFPHTLYSLAVEQIDHDGSDKDKTKDEGLPPAGGAAKDGEGGAAAVVIPEANGKE